MAGRQQGRSKGGRGWQAGEGWGEGMVVAWQAGMGRQACVRQEGKVVVAGRHRHRGSSTGEDVRREKGKRGKGRAGRGRKSV